MVLIKCTTLLCEKNLTLGSVNVIKKCLQQRRLLISSKFYTLNNSTYKSYCNATSIEQNGI